MRKTSWPALAALGLAIMTAGCSTVADKVTSTGVNVALRFTENNVFPPILSSDDLQMACVNGEALGPVMYAMGPPGLGADNDQLSVIIYATAALCSEQSALEEELRYQRAARTNRIEEAEDARSAQKRWAGVAARRQYRAYQDFEHYYEGNYHIKVGEQCPAFKRDFDEMVFMLGAISGIQALVNDINSQNTLGVPKDIAAKVERAMACLDNQKWWGVPMGVRAAVWNMLPGSGHGEDPWQIMQNSLQVGERQGVRLSFALYATAAYAKGDEKHLRDALRRYAATEENSDFKVNPRYRMFDLFGGHTVLAISDRYWTEHTGSRTPADRLGHFWDESTVEAGATVPVDDLLQ